MSWIPNTFDQVDYAITCKSRGVTRVHDRQRCPGKLALESPELLSSDAVHGECSKELPHLKGQDFEIEIKNRIDIVKGVAPIH